MTGTSSPHNGDPVVSIAVVNWNAREDLLNCLESLAANPPSAAWEAVIVDNASSDGSAAAARLSAPWAEVIANPNNVGLARANNQALARARGRFILLCNADVVFQPATVDALVATMERRPRAAFVIPRLVSPDGSIQPSVGDLPTLAEALLGRRAGAKRGSGFWWHGWDHAEERRVGHGAEACYLARAAAVGQFGPQNEGFPLDWEGVEWSRRAGAAGWEVWFCPEAEVVHVGGVSIRQARTRWIVQSHRGMYRYFSATSPPAWRIPLAAVVGLRAMTKIVVAAADRRLYDRARRSGVPAP